MNYFNKKRRNISVLFIVLIGATLIVFNLSVEKTSNIRSNLEQVTKGINEVEETGDRIYRRRRESIEDFLELSIGIQQNFKGIIEEGWRDYDSIDDFIRYHLSTIPNSAVDSIVVVVQDEEVLYKGYEKEVYSDVLNDFSAVPLTDGEFNIINGDADEPFGEGERFYYTTIELEEDTYVYIGFDEQIMFDQFITSLDLDLIYEAENIITNIAKNAYEVTGHSTQIIYILIGFMLFSIIIGFIIIFEVRRLGYNFTIEDLAEEFDSVERIKYHEGAEYDSIILNINEDEGEDSIAVVTIDEDQKMAFNIDDLDNCQSFLVESGDEQIVINKIRADERIKVDNELFYKLYNDFEFKKAGIENISKDGVKIKSKKDIDDPVNKEECLQIVFDKDIPVNNIVTGEIVHSYKKRGQLYLGINFVKFQEDDRADFINWLIKKSKEE